jgi:hypothetical protein
MARAMLSRRPERKRRTSSPLLGRRCADVNTVSNILSWKSLKPETQQKLLWDNARRFFKQT